MAEKQEEYSEYEAVDRKIIVGNLPQNCVKDLLENYFESKKHFGEGILVEKIEFQDKEAKITFNKASDVDQILQHHERKPCELVNTMLTINPCRPFGDSDAIDSGSFYHVQNEPVSTGDSDSFSCYSFRTFSSYGSLASTDLSCRSSDLFGSGRRKDNPFSKEFSTVHLVCKGSGHENIILKLDETDVSQVVVSYAATTCYMGEIVQAKQAGRNPSAVIKHEKSVTVLQNVMNTKFDNKVEITTDNVSIFITQSGQIQTITNEEEFRKAVLETITILDNHVNVELVKLDAERSDFALKHLAQVFRRNETIKMYPADDDFSFFIVYHTENEKHLVKKHIEIVSEQGILKQEKQMPMTDIFKIKANKAKIDAQMANVTYVGDCIVIQGFEEDVNTTNTVINMILHTSYCIPKKLDKYASDLLREKPIIVEIENMLKGAGMKVWWKVSDKFLNVVARNEKHASRATDMITRYFDTCKIKMTDYLLQSEKWETLKQLALNNNQKRLFIDDKSEFPVVIIRGTTLACSNCLQIVEDFKTQYIRGCQTHKMTKAKCCFALEHLNESIKVKTEGEYFTLKHGRDQTDLVVEAMEGSRKTITSIFGKISTLKFWICDENDAKVLLTISEKKDLRVPGTIHVFENQTKVIFKTGRIEDEQTEVIVNSASEDLNLDAGGDNTITRSIQLAAGEQAQKCLNKVRRPVEVGEVIKGDAGKMKCKTVLHAILRKYNPEDKMTCLEVLRRVIRTCLTQATYGGYTSITFPALCTGVHNYPIKTVAEIMFNSITEFLCQNEQLSLKEINIVFLDKDSKKKKVFEDCKAVQEQLLADMKGKHKLSTAIPWPCRYYCHITAATLEDAKGLAQNVIADLNEQTLVKRLENTE